MFAPETYKFINNDDKPYENPLNIGGFGNTFPHPYGDEENKYFFMLITASPAGDALTLDFTKSLIKNENIGEDNITDYLSVSFSSTDYVGHIFGASSLESEDQLRRLDRILADLFSFIDNKVGLENTLIILSADHGTPEISGRYDELGLDHHELNFDKINLPEGMNGRLKAEFGVGEELIKHYFLPYMYLDRDLIKEKGLDLYTVERTICDELQKIDGISHAVPSEDLREGAVPDLQLYKQIQKNYHPKRSGDIYLVPEPHSAITDVGIPVSHGSPWKYDTYVPVVFAGMNLKGEMISREISTMDVAVTLSAYIEVKYPSGARGKPLIEVIGW